MVKSGMVVLTGREKIDVIDNDVAVDWILQSVTEAVVGKRERKDWHGMDKSEIQPSDHCN
jgi:hypothetical protein